jgi:TRAP transporter TAXI family solute receptor
VLAFGFIAGSASAQTFGFATLQAGSLNHTSAAAIAKILKDKAGMNVLVQPTSGDTVILPMVDRGEADFGNGNIFEMHNAFEGQGPGGKLANLRIIGVMHTLRTGFWVRKDSDMYKVADLKGKRVGWGFSAMPTIGRLAHAMIATGGLTEKDIKPVPVPNVIRGADDFVNGAADTYEFAFGAPKVREVDASVGGTRFLEIDEKLMPEARKFFKWAYLTDIKPGPIFIGVTKPMKTFSFDNMIFANAKVKDEVVYKVLDTMTKYKKELMQIQPVLIGFSAENSYKTYDVPYHPGALKYFKDHNIKPMALQ